MLWQTPVEPQRQMPLCGEARLATFGRPSEHKYNLGRWRG
jgi:hypothetical protein